MMKLEVHTSILELAETFPAVLLDAYGVFWAGNAFGFIPGAKEAMERLVALGKAVGILSNTTQLAQKEIDKLAKVGLIQGKHYHYLLTSGEVAKAFFTTQTLPFPTPRNRYWIWGEPHPKYHSPSGLFLNSGYLETADISEADFIYISIPHIGGEDQTDPERFRDRVESCLHVGIPMVCANPDRFAHEGNPPRAVVRQGSIAMLYEEMGGEVFYLGKPSSLAYQKAMELFAQCGIALPNQVLMVGDTPETDIRGARRCGMLSALVIGTGIMAERIRLQGLEQALEALPSGDRPDYLLRGLSPELLV